MTTASTAAAARTCSAGGDGNDRIHGGRGADTVDAGAGDDKVNVRDHAADTVDCGAGTDRVIADKADTLTGCEDEKVRRGGHPKPPKRTRRRVTGARSGAVQRARRPGGRRAAFL